MLAAISILFAAVRFILRWALALVAALLVPPLALLVRPWMRRRKLNREDTIVALVGLVERCCGCVYRSAAALLGHLLYRRLYRSCERFNAFRESPLGERLLARWGFDDIYVSLSLDLLGGGFNWHVKKTKGPSFEGCIGGHGTWCKWMTAEERAAEPSGLALMMERFRIQGAQAKRDRRAAARKAKRDATNTSEVSL